MSKILVVKLFSRNEVVACFFRRRAWNVGEWAEWLKINFTKPLNSYHLDYKQSNNNFVFPELKKAILKDPKDIYIKSKTENKKFNKYLKQVANKAELQKKDTMYIAKHTFSHISEDKILIRVFQKFYKHSYITRTINHQVNFIHKDADYALGSVVNF